MTTVFDSIRDTLLTTLDRLDMRVVRFAVQAALFTVCPTIACALAYIRNVRMVPIQVSLCVMAWITLLCIPVDRLEVHNATARLWLLSTAILVVVFTPPLLGFLLVPNPLASRRVTQGIYAAIVGLAIWQLLAGGGA